MPRRSLLAPVPTVADLLACDTQPIPGVLAGRGEADVPMVPIQRGRYYDPDFARLEFERLWSSVWQMACRLEDIPEVGDHILYDIGDLSLIVVRSAVGEVRAFFNACLHRGRALRDEDGSARYFRCPFHGFAWNLDGSCRHITNAWDFTHVDKADFALPEARVGVWGGFVFLNPSPDGDSLETFLEDVPVAYETRGWSLAERRKTVHVQKINRCNWKVALEAFIESFHVTHTHRSAAPYLGDANSQYDVWEGKKHTRMISPRGIASPNIAALSDVEIFRIGTGGGDEVAGLPEGALSARAAMAEARRQTLVRDGVPFAAAASDCEMIDTIHYHVFPNLVCWAGWGSYLTYRFRPLGTDPDMSVMDIMFLDPKAGDASVPKPQRIGPDESHQSAPQLGGFAKVFDEDSGNLAALQRGLKTMRGVGPVTATYQEARIRHFHNVLGDYVGRD